MILMNETIGVKGGKNDRRRSLLITKKAKEKLQAYQEEKELKKLEEKVKKNQILAFFKIFPIITLGQVYTSIVENLKKKKELAIKELIELLKKENIFQEKEIDEIISALKSGNLYSLDQTMLEKLGISLERYKHTSEIDLSDLTNDYQKVSQETSIAIIKVEQIIKQENNKQNNQQEINQQDIQNKTSQETIEEKITKLKNHKIVDEYENKLKEIRIELKKVIFEYNIICDNADNVYTSKESEKLLEKLNQIIKKVEELKNKIAVADIDEYDSNYLYTLIEEHIDDFKNKQLVEEIKDSELYIMISEKLAELDRKKDILQEELEVKKYQLEIDEEKLEELKEATYGYDQFNQKLLVFQLEQDYLLNEIREKMSKATTVEQKVKIQVEGINQQTSKLLNIITTLMLIPGARSAKTLAIMTATSLYFMKNIINPRPINKRYKTITITDYHKDIERSLSDINDISILLKKTSKQIDIIITEFEKEFSQYFGIIPECQKLLDDLNKIKNELNEKEYELERIKEEQEKNLEKNDAKVKKYTYE